MRGHWPLPLFFFLLFFFLAEDLAGARFLDPHNGPRTALGLPALTWSRKRKRISYWNSLAGASHDA